jgi:3-oxoacyl-[acyl-carrier-protein] synthase-3
MIADRPPTTAPCRRRWPREAPATARAVRTGIGIVGLGAYVPPRRVSNHALAEVVHTSDEWITQRTGICERRYAGADTATSDLAVEAARSALQDAGLTPQDVGLIVLATSSPDWIQPATACAVHAQLGLRRVPAFDVSAVCSGFVYALTVGASMLQTSPEYRSVLVIGAETFSKLLDFQDRTSSVFFGDGAGAVLLSAVPSGFGLLSTHLVTEGSLHDVVKVPAGGSRLVTTAETLRNRQHYFRMDGRRVWDFVTEVAPEVVAEALRKADLELGDVDLFIFHQANRVLINTCLGALGVDPSRAHFTLDRYGNTAAASVPITLQEAVALNRVKRGDHVLLVSMGGGMTAAAAAIRWY